MNYLQLHIDPKPLKGLTMYAIPPNGHKRDIYL